MDRLWQDLARTIPAVADGDPVAVWENEGYPDFVQANPARRPVLRDDAPEFVPDAPLIVEHAE